RLSIGKSIIRSERKILILRVLFMKRSMCRNKVPLTKREQKRQRVNRQEAAGGAVLNPLKRDNVVKFTPLNITLACILVWFVSELTLDGTPLLSLGWMVVLLILLALLDLGFRLIFTDIKR